MYIVNSLVSGSLALLFVSLANATPIASPAHVARQSDPFCSGQSPGIYEPADGSTINQVMDDDYDCTTVEFLYCSGQYDKTRSIDTSIWLSASGAASGQLLAKDVQPDNDDAAAGFYSYRYNVTICPEDGNYMTGSQTLSVYETETGRYSTWNSFV